MRMNLHLDPISKSNGLFAGRTLELDTEWQLSHSDWEHVLVYISNWGSLLINCRG